MTKASPCDCPCRPGQRPMQDGHDTTDLLSIECGNCGRMVCAVGREEAVRMWNAALCNMTDNK